MIEHCKTLEEARSCSNPECNKRLQLLELIRDNLGGLKRNTNDA